MTDQNLTLLALIADRSGSMTSIARDMNGGIATLLAEQGRQPGALAVDIWTFDDHVEHPFDWVRPDDVKADIIVPRGRTALNDAVGTAIVSIGERLAAMDEDDRPHKVIVCVVTDGAENASTEYTLDRVQELVKTQTEQYGWEFMYLAANVDAFATGGAYGFAKGSTMSYGATSAGAASSLAAASAGITRSRLGGAADFTDAERQNAGGQQ
ncbi:DNA ligase [Microbacterium phage Metamorphoo]|uniref:DNA ligase n=1 Tax=Microbacterium phage Metamorphoo TaxID=2201437 RepID=A0A2Z4Q5W7_9CAUD|nr:DNA ligase [Microbacterium phage Metamorphoo]AWY05414.1 DNA ligase [Microbacterium phage Metamorphoo]